MQVFSTIATRTLSTPVMLSDVRSWLKLKFQDITFNVYDAHDLAVNMRIGRQSEKLICFNFVDFFTVLKGYPFLFGSARLSIWGGVKFGKGE